MEFNINPIYTEKVIDLINALVKAGIPHETEISERNEGFIIYFPDKKNRTGDVILHNYSYGHEWGGFEGYRDMSTIEGDVCVFATPEEVVEHAKKQNFKRGE